MTVCLLVASSGITAQVRTIPKVEKSSIQKFIEKTSKLKHLAKNKQKAEQEDLITGLDIIYYDMGSWFYGTRVDFNYESGLLTQQIAESRVDTEWIVESKMTNTYTNGRLTQELYEELNYMSGELEPYERYSYSYNNEVLAEVVYEEWVDGKWVIGYKDTFTITNGQISEGIIYYWVDDTEDWEAMERYSMEETNDTLIYTTQVRWETEEWENYERDMYPGLTVQGLLDYVFSFNATLHLSAILIYNQFPDYIYQEWDGEKWLNIEQQYSTLYHSSNQLLETKYINTVTWEEGEPVPSTSLVHYYNEKENPDSTVLNINNGWGENQEWSVYMRENYTYSQEGLMDEINVSFGSLIAYQYKFEWNGVSVSNENPEKPTTFKLNNAYPNPFNPTTNISYSVAQPGYVKLMVYDMLGRYITTLVNGMQSSGDHTVQFNAAGLSSGMYIVRMEAPGYIKTQKMTLLK
ncbi:Por secretion system C-terminal sorting domain-containing protein [Gracilimonas mengyeensis]|uniref:Por secretion system C-terminal sorting domain-containing protein n=2 Tax=Gracilimonas mengyeensis TaxID=1302730 RepID=A0A521C046_9BACT|nr:Por secretion system C-terminal sorting domain-containing protein [Gracilimonas mengyeensis]